MGVQARLRFYAPDTTTALEAARAAFDRLAELDVVLSAFLADSELMRLTRSTAGEPVPVSDDLFHVLETAQRLAAQTSGAFDVTVGPYVRLWREARREGSLPDPEALAEASRRVGRQHLVLDAKNRTATLRIPGMQLDLGGIGKGYAADEAVAVLARHGIDRAMVEFGGDVVATCPPPGASGWTVAAVLAGPATIELRHAALSTSGDTEQFVVIDGTRYSHVVDPRTGIGLTNRTAATVIAGKGILADALATALTVMGTVEGLAFIEREYPEVRAYVRELP